MEKPPGINTAEAEQILDLAAVPAKNPLGVGTLLLGAAEARWLVHDMQGALDAARGSLAASASIAAPFAALVRAWAQLGRGDAVCVADQLTLGSGQRCAAFGLYFVENLPDRSFIVRHVLPLGV